MISNIIRNFSGEEVEPYLTFKSTTAMTIKPVYTNTGVTLQYSLNAKTWTTIASNAVTPSASVIYFRGSATGTKRLYTGSNPSNTWVFTNATNLEVHGDMTMLLQGTLGGMVRDIPLGSYAFEGFFYGFSNLIKAPNLPSTSLGTYCYSDMFNGCTSLTIAPKLPATTLASNCYFSMFRGCTSLTSAPKLPATTLANNCYSGMFNGCTSLTTAPALPATTLTDYCYSNMLYGCTKIKLSTTKTGNYQTAYRIPTVGTGVSASNAFLQYMFSNTGGTFVGTPAINTTYYTENVLV